MLRTSSGRQLPLAVARWHAPPDGDEQVVLDRALGPVLDIGCGPGRHALELSARGVIALGVDCSPMAVAHARQRGCPVLHRSVFDRLPREGRWATVLLIDGNIGIGGDPVRLLQRARQLIRPHGCLLVEVEAPGIAVERTFVRLEHAGQTGPWFAWARVGVDGIDRAAASAGLRRSWSHATTPPSGETRWFVQLS
jgi:SAM-dependent methyltransferase